jgi:hypothetical protein
MSTLMVYSADPKSAPTQSRDREGVVPRIVTNLHLWFNGLLPLIWPM